MQHFFSIAKVKRGIDAGRNSGESHSCLQGHAIMFDHVAPQVARESLLSQERIMDAMSLHFVGPSGELDSLM